MSEISTTPPRQESALPSSDPHVPLPEDGNARQLSSTATSRFVPGTSTGYEQQHEVEPRGRSKRRRLNTTDFARRKRVLEACQFCRVRKVKCDSARPRCGFCIRHDARCIYKDVRQVVESEPTHVPNEPVPSERIMARLDEIKELLLRDPLKSHSVSAPATAIDPSGVVAPRDSGAADNPFPGPTPSPWARFSHISTSGSESQRRHQFPYAALRCEGLLRWPCLASVIPEGAADIDSFPLSTGYREARKIQETRYGRGINENALVPLCEKFLAAVYPRNPVLDDHELLRHARHAAGNGLCWDSSSCLVLLACALGSYAAPWVKPKEQLQPFHETQLQTMMEEDQEGAEAYYAAAQKRLGILCDSIQDIQCFFLATMFEKTALRPLRAWHHIQQACNRLETRLLQRGERPLVPFREPNPENHLLEQRLFWSCLRAESELVFELGIKPGCLEGYSYPDAFPAPPDYLFSETSPVTTDTSPTNSPPSSIDTPRQIKQGWYFYLAEISARRMMDETLNLLYSHGPEYWMKNPAYLIRQYHECDNQVSSWHGHLPALVQFDNDVFPDDELAQGLQARASLWREYTLRPIFYYVLHAPEGQDVPSEAHDLAAKEIQICITTIQRCSFHRRNGGVWFVCRNIFTAGCLILAAALHPQRVQPPQQWQGLVELAIQALHRWGRDAYDIRKMGDTLHHMYQARCRQG
ncbi:hypothetical protein ACJZ2D_001376 [Fusarium nematophilum]